MTHNTRNEPEAPRYAPVFAAIDPQQYQRPQAVATPPAPQPNRLGIILGPIALGLLLAGILYWGPLAGGRTARELAEARSVLAEREAELKNTQAELVKFQEANQQIGAIAQDQANRIATVKAAVCEGGK